MKIRALVALLRPHQWSKNVLVFAPLFFSGKWSAAEFVASAGAFVLMCAAASSAYSLNDVFDCERDRKHPLKKHRPVAAGAITTIEALLIGILLAALALLFGWQMTPALFEVLICYLLLQLAYSLVLKRYPILDILSLSTSFLLRVLVGVAATSIYPSTWILIFTALLALLLAAGKRYAELSRAHGKTGETRAVLSEYPLEYLGSLLTSIGAVAIVCYLLWCGETATEGRFLARAIFPSAFFVAFAILRYQLLIFQGAFPEDPTVGLMKDPPIIASAVLYAAYVGWVIAMSSYT